MTSSRLPRVRKLMHFFLMGAGSRPPSAKGYYLSQPYHRDLITNHNKATPREAVWEKEGDLKLNSTPLASGEKQYIIFKISL